MPKLAQLSPSNELAPLASIDVRPKRNRPLYFVLFFLFFSLPLVAVHLTLLDLPFFWDEHGQFVPTALDLLRSGAWIAHSTIPNVHPPGVEAYLALWYKLFGFSIPVTRLAMLVFAGAGLFITFLLSIELGQATTGAPAFLPPLFLFASPLFFTQSMMAQLDMPAMALSLLCLLLFLKRQYIGAAAACSLLVLTKETGVIFPIVFLLILALRKQKEATYFFAAPIFLGGWLIVLHHATGYWLGNPGFAHYNVEYSLHPVRIALSFVRRIYYLLFAEFRWIGTACIAFAAWKHKAFSDQRWTVTLGLSVLMIVLVSVLGGAELERYLLPVLPIFYIAVSAGLSHLPRRIAAFAIVALVIGLGANLFWNPPYPFPFENNLAMVDFVRLQQTAARFVEQSFPGETVATAWPYTAALRNLDYGFVRRPMNVIETNDFHASSIQALMPGSFDVLIIYTRTWMPPRGVITIPFVRRFLERFYDWEPPITSRQCAELGLREFISWRRRGQEIRIFVRGRGFRSERAHL